MKTYQVTVNFSFRRKFQQAEYHVIAEVQAKSRKEAKEKALKKEFSDTFVSEDHLSYSNIELAKFVITK